MQKLLTFFQQKYWHIWKINFWKFNETLTNDVVRFEQPGPHLCQETITEVIRPQLKVFWLSKDDSTEHSENWFSKDTSGTDRIRTQSLTQTSKGKMDKHIPTNNKITGDKPSQQLFPKQVATRPYLLNQTNRTHKSVKIKTLKNKKKKKRKKVERKKGKHKKRWETIL